MLNKCKWLWKNDRGTCNKNCVGEYCATHNQQIKNGSPGRVICIRCGFAIKGKTKLCYDCGGMKYRTFTRYYKKNII